MLPWVSLHHNNPIIDYVYLHYRSTKHPLTNSLPPTHNSGQQYLALKCIFIGLAERQYICWLLNHSVQCCAVSHVACVIRAIAIYNTIRNLQMPHRVQGDSDCKFCVLCSFGAMVSNWVYVPFSLFYIFEFIGIKLLFTIFEH